MGIAVGIDLGTTNSCVAVVQNNRARVLEDSAGRRIHPSILSFLPDGSVVAGHAARDRKLTDPSHTVYAGKRLIGRNLESEETKRLLKDLPYTVKAGPDGIPVVEVRNRQISLPEISAMMLRHLKTICEEKLNLEIEQAVITVPANFDDVQRSSTKVAGRIAGFDVLRIINEPTAAALAYGFGGGRTERIAVYDFGGGTFDITVVELSDDIFEVLSTAGDTYLGGADFDEAVISEMLREFKKSHKIDLSEDPAAMQRLRAAAERVKCQLSTLNNVQATLQNIAVSPKGKKLDFFFKISRARFEELVRPLVDRSLTVCEEALKLAGLKPSELDNLVMVGGTTRIPLVRKRAAEVFGIVPRTEINPDEVVAIGAAIQAFSLTGEQLPDVLPKNTPKLKGAPTKGAPTPRKNGSPPPAPPPPPKMPRPVEGTAKPPAPPSSAALSPTPSPNRPPVTVQKPVSVGAPSPAPVGPSGSNEKGAPDTPSSNGEALGLDVKRAEKKPLFKDEALGLAVKQVEKKPQFKDEALGLDVKRAEKKPPFQDEPLGLNVKHPEKKPLFKDEALGLDVKRAEKKPPFQDEPLGLDVKQVKKKPQFKDEALGLDVKRVEKKPLAKEDALGLDVKGRAVSSDGVLDLTVKRGGAGLDTERRQHSAAPGIDFDLDVKHPSGLDLELKRPSGLDLDVKHQSGLDVELKRPSGLDLDVKHRSGLDVELKHPSGLDLDVKHEGAPIEGVIDLDGKPPSGPLSDVLSEPPIEAGLDAIGYRETLPKNPEEAGFEFAEPAEYEEGEDAETAHSMLSLSEPPAGAPSETISDADFGALPGITMSIPPEDEVGGVPGEVQIEDAVPSQLDSPASVEVTDAARAMGALLLDVTPRALGIAVAGGFCDIVIDRNAAIPVEQSRVFVTSADNQTEVAIDIYQGESRRIEDNTKLGHILLSNLRKAPRGGVKIRVTFEIDTDGILGVSARDEMSNEAERTQIVLAGGMDEARVNALVEQYSAK